MELTQEEQQILAGAHGEAARNALQYQIRVGEYYGAKKFVPITQAHITADIEVMGDTGLQFLKEQVENDAKFVVPATTNARCIDFTKGLELGQSQEMIHKELEVMDTVKNLGAMTIDTCINYQVVYQPHVGEHVAWGDTGTVIYANSVFGARTNYESGPAAFAASVTGRVPAYGFHLDENRLATCIFQVEAEMKDIADWGILGRIIGEKVFDYKGVPAITNVAQYQPTSDDLKHLGASMATWSVAMFHVVGVTPEARTIEDATGGCDVEVITITEQDMQNGYDSFSYEDPKARIIALSGPQLSLIEIETIAKLLDGKSIHEDTTFIITAAASTYLQAQQAGYVKMIERAGGEFLTGVCFYILDGLSDIRQQKRWQTLVTNSVKLANNVKAHRFVPVVRTTQECVEIAIKGELT